MLSPRRAHVRVLGFTLALLAVGALAVTPALAVRFLTKQKADKRYLGNTIEVTTTQTFASFTGGSMTAMCPTGKQAVGGGADSPALLSGGATDTMLLTESKPELSGGRSVGWTVEVASASSDPLTITAHAVCVP